MAEPTVLRSVLGDYPHTAALKNGDISSDQARFEFTSVSPIHRAFAPMVRDEAYDFSELAVVTALQAVAYDRPVVLLPAVVASRFQRGCLIAHSDRPVDPAKLAGSRVGVRSYTQTTGMWVRAHLAEDFGVQARDVHWITHQEAHVAQYADPDFVERRADATNLPDMLREGRADAVVLGNDLPSGDEFVRVVTDAAERDQQWYQQHGFMPVNHMVVAGQTAARRNPAAIREAYTMLRRSDAAVERPGDAPSPTLFGFEKLRPALEFMVETCLAQGLLPRRLDVDEVFAPAREILGADGD